MSFYPYSDFENKTYLDKNLNSLTDNIGFSNVLMPYNISMPAGNTSPLLEPRSNTYNHHNPCNTKYSNILPPDSDEAPYHHQMMPLNRNMYSNPSPSSCSKENSSNLPCQPQFKTEQIDKSLIHPSYVNYDYMTGMSHAQVTDSHETTSTSVSKIPSPASGSAHSSPPLQGRGESGQQIPSALMTRTPSTGNTDSVKQEVLVKQEDVSHDTSSSPIKSHYQYPNGLVPSTTYPHHNNPILKAGMVPVTSMQSYPGSHLLPSYAEFHMSMNPVSHLPVMMSPHTSIPPSLSNVDSSGADVPSDETSNEEDSESKYSTEDTTTEQKAKSAPRGRGRAPKAAPVVAATTATRGRKRTRAEAITTTATTTLPTKRGPRRAKSPANRRANSPTASVIEEDESVAGDADIDGEEDVDRAEAAAREDEQDARDAKNGTITPDELKRRRLARKAELARLSRKYKKTRLADLEEEVVKLREELAASRNVPAAPLRLDDLQVMLQSILTTIVPAISAISEQTRIPVTGVPNWYMPSSDTMSKPHSPIHPQMQYPMMNYNLDVQSQTNHTQPLSPLDHGAIQNNGSSMNRFHPHPVGTIPISQSHAPVYQSSYGMPSHLQIPPNNNSNSHTPYSSSMSN